MGNKPKPPVFTEKDLDHVEAGFAGRETDVLFRQNLKLWGDLLGEGKISPFAYYAEILAFIVRAHVNDREWANHFNKVIQRDEPADCVTIPVAFLGPLTEGWTKFREADHNLSLGRACGVEAGGKTSGQGKRNDRDAFNQFEMDYHLALRVVAMRSFAGQRGEALNLPDAISRVAEQFEAQKGLGRKRVENAYERQGKRVLDQFARVGLSIDPSNIEKSEGS